jgi:hypothetical protein
MSNVVNSIIKKNLLFDEVSLNNKFRYSMLDQAKQMQSYGIANQIIVEPYSSGDEDLEEECSDEPTMEEVCEGLFDLNVIREIVIHKYFFIFRSMKMISLKK